MYKNMNEKVSSFTVKNVSILVLMDLCIKTGMNDMKMKLAEAVSILVLMDLCIKTFCR